MKKFAATVLCLFALALPAMAADETTELHNSFQTAQVIPASEEVAGSIATYSDQDYYKVHVEEDGILYLSFRHDAVIEGQSSQYYWNVCVYGGKSLETPILDFGITGDGKLTQNFCDFAAAEGDYYIKVTSSTRHTTLPYYTALNFSPADNWEKPDHATFPAAQELSDGVLINGSTPNKYDRDVYKFRLDDPGYITLTFDSPSHPNYDYECWTVNLFNQDYQQIEQYHVKGNTSKTTYGYIGLDKNGEEEYYYIQVLPYSDANYTMYPYQLTYNYYPADDWEKELNNTFADAESLAVSSALTQETYVKGCVSSFSDQDLYRFTLPASGKVAPHFDHDYVETDANCWAITLYDAAHTPIYTFSVPGRTPQFRPDAVELDAGAYYLGVASDPSTTHQGVYTLSIYSDVIPAVGVTLDETDLLLALGDAHQLTAAIAPANATVQDLIWTSSDPYVVSVDTFGLIQTKAAGSAQITVATADGGYTASCAVTVIPRTALDYTLRPLSLRAGDGSGALTAIPESGSFWVTVPVTKNVEVGNAIILVAAYGENGQFLQLFAADFSGLERGQTLRLSFCVTASGVRRLKAFAVTSLDNLTPLAPAVEFPR